LICIKPQPRRCGSRRTLHARYDFARGRRRRTAADGRLRLWLRAHV